MRLRQYHTRSYQYDQINKTADRMYALLTMACALSPTRLDENIQTQMREKYGDQFNKMTKGGAEGVAAFEELFLYACPKTRRARSSGSSGSLLEGEVVNTSDLDFVIDTNMVHIAESRVGRRYGDWFLRNGTRMHDVLGNIQSKPLPIVSKEVRDEAAAAAAAAAAAGAEGKGDRRGQKSGWAGAAARFLAPTSFHRPVNLIRCMSHAERAMSVPGVLTIVRVKRTIYSSVTNFAAHQGKSRVVRVGHRACCAHGASASSSVMVTQTLEGFLNHLSTLDHTVH
ncbi:hypothetical protein L1887_52880 [Cichorium endivia]|nr:hypothetical protein L1887_52880 [Cichorium endivia]